jgi:hypothetical protein
MPGTPPGGHRHNVVEVQQCRRRLLDRCGYIFVAPGGESVLKTDAPPLKLPAPEIVTLDDSVSGNERILRLRLTSLRRADVLRVALEKVTVLRATIGGKKLPSKTVEPNDRLLGFYYAVPPAGEIELDIAVGLADAPRLTRPIRPMVYRTFAAGTSSPSREMFINEGLPVTRAKDYSYLKATIGSTRIARRAGM